MAENKETKTTKTKEVQTESSVSTFQVVGPKESENGAAILRFNRDRNRKAIDLVPGQTFTVGENGDITEDESKKLFSYNRWEFKEVTE